MATYRLEEFLIFSYQLLRINTSLSEFNDLKADFFDAGKLVFNRLEMHAHTQLHPINGTDVTIQDLVPKASPKPKVSVWSDAMKG